LPGPLCALYPGPHPELKLWVRAGPGQAVEIRAGERPVQATGEVVKGGLRFRHVPLPAAAPVLTVRLRGPDGTRGPVWSLHLTRPEMPAWLAEVAELQSGGRTAEIALRLQELRKVAPRREQGFLLRDLAVLALAAGRDDEAVGWLTQGIAADHAEGMLRGEIDQAALLARIHLDHGRFADARRVLPVVPAVAPADVKYLVAYDLGLLADQVGDYRATLGQLRQAADLAERVGMDTYRWQSEQVLARVLQGLGRSEEAAPLFARLREARAESPCDRGTLLTNEAWSQLLAREGGENAGDPRPALTEALTVFDAGRCPAVQRLNARINLALADQQEGLWPEARQVLEQAAPLAAQANVRERLWWLDLQGREAIADGDPARALRSYDELAKVAARSSSPEGRFRAALGRARAHLRIADRDEHSRRVAALADLAEADRLIDTQSWLIPAHEGRDTFIAQREAATRLYLELLLADGQRRRAFDLARRDRSRLLRQLVVTARLSELTPAAQRAWDEAMSRYWNLRDAVDRQAADEWQLPGDQVKRAREDRESQLAQARKDLDAAMASLAGSASGEEPENESLSPPRPGEVILAYHPLPHGWVAFAAHAKGIEVTTFDLPFRPIQNPDILGRMLLAPFRTVLEPAERVRVLAYGSRLRSVDFDGLTLDGVPLLARHLVVYSLDLPARLSTRPPSRTPDRRAALLVADPEGNLPAARPETEAVEAAIRSWGAGWAITRLNGPAAKAETLRTALPGIDLFHFAGHGNFAGLGGWESELRLAGGSRLSLGDILALRRVPAWVVLSSCDAGHSSDQASGEGAGLAQAFLLAGSRSVIAATRPVADATAAELVRELYRGWQPGGDLARQFQRAQLACRRRAPAADWASFRLFEP
jgi:hypothetical protein